jgi:hypothetical protein
MKGAGAEVGCDDAIEQEHTRDLWGIIGEF